jgi:hypothetical protein
LILYVGFFWSSRIAEDFLIYVAGALGEYATAR